MPAGAATFAAAGRVLSRAGAPAVTFGTTGVDRPPSVARSQSANEENVLGATQLGLILPIVSMTIRPGLQALPGPPRWTNRLLLFGLGKIRDSGSGLDPSTRDHLFDPFFSTKDDGLGLGLYISRTIIDDHEGTIEVESEIGEGTEFSIWLPGMNMEGEE